MSVARPTRSSFAQRPIPAAAGIGLRPGHLERVLEQRPAVRWFEVHAENLMSASRVAMDLRAIADSYPLSLHAVGLSLGSISLPNTDHLERLRELVDSLRPGLVSDHLSWSQVDGAHLPDLLPLPFTEEALQVVTRNTLRAQEVLGRRLLIENPSRYLSLPESTLNESEFLSELVLRSGCGLLLDINNLYVTAINNGESPTAALAEMLSRIAPEHIGEIHLAGHELTQLESGRWLLVDTHSRPVCPEVWDLFEAAISQLGPVPTLVEWDSDLPSFSVLVAESVAAEAILAQNIPECRHARLA
jgi:hypothetical protein